MTMTVANVLLDGNGYPLQNPDGSYQTDTPVAIGQCLYGTEIGMVDYSRKERDTFGNITLIERGYSDLVRFKVEVLTANTDQIRQLIASKRVRLATYIGANELTVTHVTGYLTSFSLSLDDWQHSSLSIEVEGVTHG